MYAKIVVVGTGGIGGVIAARLARAGLDVTAVTGNAEIATALAARGFTVTEFEGETWTHPAPRVVRAADELPANDAPFDLCIVATKATTLVDALAAVGSRLRDDAPVV